MNTEILGVALQILLLIVISYPLGKHIAKVYKEGNDCMRFMAPIERFIYKLAGINPNEEMDWKVFLKSLLIINVFWFFWGMILLVSQGYLTWRSIRVLVLWLTVTCSTIAEKAV